MIAWRLANIFLDNNTKKNNSNSIPTIMVTYMNEACISLDSMQDKIKLSVYAAKIV